MAADREPPPHADATAARAAPGRGWTPARVIAMVFASLGGLIGLALLAGGVAVLVAFASERENGYFSTDSKRLASSTYAITTERVDLGADEVDWAPEGLLGTVRLRAEGRTAIFIGIGPDADVARYLAGVGHAELVDFGGDVPELDPRRGKAPRSRPSEQKFWVAQAEGRGAQAISWHAEFGRWTAVVMNADASRGVAVEADAGVKLGWALWAGLGATLLGLLMCAGAVVVIVLVGRRAAP